MYKPLTGSKSDERARPSSRDALSDLFTEIGAVIAPLLYGAWPGAAGSLARVVRVASDDLDRALGRLAPGARRVAGVLLDPGEASLGTSLDRLIGRMAALAEGASEVMRALHADDPEWIEAHFAALEQAEVSAAHPDRHGQGTGPESFLHAAVIGLADHLPLGVDGVEVLARLGSPAIGIAVGRAAQAGDPGARLLLREALALVDLDDRVRLGLIAGLGEGLLDLGLDRVVALASRAIAEAPRWGLAALEAAGLVAHAAAHPTALPSPRARLEAMVAAFSLAANSEEGTRFLDDLPEAVRVEVLTLTRHGFASRPPAVRASVVQDQLRRAVVGAAHVSAGAERPRDLADADSVIGPPADLLRERSPQVLSMVIELIGRLGDALPAELRAALARAFSDHPDLGVRKALAAAIPPRAAQPVATDTAEVIALPPAALARDDLDRLRAALWAGESEKIVELSTCVPLDRRAAARESLLAAIEIPNAPLRRAIIEAVGRIGSQVDGARLVDAARRYRALEGTVATALRELSAKALAEPLAEVYQRRLKWADDDAVDDYCAIAGPEQVAHLLRALETRYYPSARAGAARALARRRASEVVFALRSAGLSDTQETARLAALGALHDLAGTSPGSAEIAGHALLFRSTEELPEAIERAREAGTAALAGIRRTLARGSWKRRRAACDVLSTMPSEDAIHVLVGVLEDPDEDVRAAAVEALEQRGWEPLSPRERTLHALATRRVREVMGELVRVAELSRIGEFLDVPTLITALGYGGHVFRAEVLDALAVLLALTGHEPTREEAAIIAAARMDVRRAVEFPGGLDAVLRAVDHTWQANPHRSRFVPGLKAVPTEVLIHELDGPWSWRAREAIAQALERPGDALALETLGRLVTEDDDDVRRAALQSLAWIGSEAAAEQVALGFRSPFQEDRDVVGRALGAFGPRAAALIDRLSEDPWWESRQGAALALSHWKSEVQGAADRLVALAADPEYRVAQTARDALLVHGILPTVHAVCAALSRAQTLTIEGLEPWLGLHRAPTAAPEVAHALDALFETWPANLLPQRLGLVSTFRAEHLALWLESLALGQATRHVGVRLAASDALRALLRRACAVCSGDGKVRCPGCAGAGDVGCPTCTGRGLVLVRCPDPACTAHGTLRRIDSRRCATCRGRGEVPTPCTTCEGARGRVACELCHGGGRLACAACDGTGHARALVGHEADHGPVVLSIAPDAGPALDVLPSD